MPQGIVPTTAIQQLIHNYPLHLWRIDFKSAVIEDMATLNNLTDKLLQSSREVPPGMDVGFPQAPIQFPHCGKFVGQ